MLSRGRADRCVDEYLASSSNGGSVEVPIRRADIGAAHIARTAPGLTDAEVAGGAVEVVLRRTVVDVWTAEATVVPVLSRSERAGPSISPQSRPMAALGRSCAILGRQSELSFQWR